MVDLVRVDSYFSVDYDSLSHRPSGDEVAIHLASEKKYSATLNMKVDHRSKQHN